MVQEGIVDLCRFTVVNGILPKQKIRHERVHCFTQSGLKSCDVFCMIGKCNDARDLLVNSWETQAKTRQYASLSSSLAINTHLPS